MNILFIHQNFPGQFKHLAPALADLGHQVTALVLKHDGPARWQGVRIIPYAAHRGTTPGIHPWVLNFETKVIRGEALFREALRLRSEGYYPEIIIAHPGWGESLFVKDVWPQAKLGSYCEFFYQAEGGDANFDPEFSAQDADRFCRLKMNNLNNQLSIEAADAGISPTSWQASTFPAPYREKISVIHDGIDTSMVAPNPYATLNLNKKIPLSRKNEIITFVNRNLEPYRGYHIFMRALPGILKRRPNARVLIVGGDEVSYGNEPPEGKTWKNIFLDEVKQSIGTENLQRVHFLGRVPYQILISMFQISTVHVYLTYPFVLSWSLLEAMCTGCAVVASDTKPLHEVIEHNENGRLVDFFDSDNLADEVIELLRNQSERNRLGTNAWRFGRDHYDLKSVCLEQQIQWVLNLAD